MKFFITLITILLIKNCFSVSANSGYSLQDIKIDVSDDSILKARAQAILLAQKKAFGLLVARLIKSDEMNDIKISDFDLLTLIEDFEIQEEKNSTTRYMGTFTVRFKNKEVDKYLIDQGNVLKTEENNDTTLVIPLYEKDQILEIWQENNPWLQAWKEKQDLDFHHRLMFGDLKDKEIVSFTGANLQKNNFSSLTHLMKRYQTQRLLIVILKQQKPYCMDVFFYNAQGYELKKRVIFQNENDLTDNLISKAMKKALEIEKNFMNKKNENDFVYHKILVDIKFDKFDDWQLFKKTILATDVIQKFIVISLKHNEAQILLHSMLEIYSMKTFLSQLGFNVSKHLMTTPKIQIDISKKESFN